MNPFMQIIKAFFSELIIMTLSILTEVLPLPFSRKRPNCIRSASRFGYNDFGVGRRRIERLRTALQQAEAIA
jgi:hypothetical protein